MPSHKTRYKYLIIPLQSSSSLFFLPSFLPCSFHFCFLPLTLSFFPPSLFHSFPIFTPFLSTFPHFLFISPFFPPSLSLIRSTKRRNTLKRLQTNTLGFSLIRKKKKKKKGHRFILRNRKFTFHASSQKIICNSQSLHNVSKMNDVSV